MFTFARVRWWNIVQVKMLYRNSIQFKFQKPKSVIVDWLESHFWIESQDFTPEHCTSWQCCVVCLRLRQKQRPTCPLYHQGPSRPIPLRLRENLKIMKNNEGRMYWNLVVLISESFSMPCYLKNQFPANDTLFYKFIFGKRGRVQHLTNFSLIVHHMKYIFLNNQKLVIFHR